MHYDTALKWARSESVRFALIEALLARGRWAAKIHAVGARSSRPGSGVPTPTLDNAFNGYRIYKADVRNALGWAYLANGEKQKAKESAERTLQMSKETGYYWGKVDAEEVLEKENRSCRCFGHRLGATSPLRG